jgi:hypothetical protein
MSRVVREPEMMDVDEPVMPELAVPKTAAPEPTKHDEQPKDEEEYEEAITLRASDFVAF